jgi:hypothetical protein
MKKIIIPVIATILALSLGLSQDVYGPEDQPENLTLGGNGFFKAIHAKLMAVNNNYPDLSDKECSLVTNSDDTVTISCDDGSEISKIISEKQLAQIRDLLESIDREIEEVQNNQNDWDFIRERAD